jgi:RNA polymerase sigma-70 factor, ECF subfamily
MSKLAAGRAEADRQAFEAAALPHFPDIYGAARRAVSQPANAEDLTQEVFLRAWKSFHCFQQGTNCKAWLMAILFYMCLNHRRQIRRSNAVSWEPEFDNRIASPPLSVPSKVDLPLLEAVNALPPSYRTVLIMADVYEYSYREIAAIVRVPIGTVMSRLNRARNQLRRLLTLAAPPAGELE